MLRKVRVIRQGQRPFQGEKPTKARQRTRTGWEQKMTHSAMRQLVTLTLATALLAGCEDGMAGFGAKTTNGGAVELVDATASPKPQKPSKNDVESPDIFSTTGEALWDGRPSLGGIWVAAPDAVNPERVIIRNSENGKSVTGALFRRERENPGPPLQISSDAAAALGLLAGQPGTISVVALSRAKPEPTPAAEEPAVAVDAAVEQDPTTPAVATDVGAVASAAIDAAESLEPAVEGAEAAAAVAAPPPPAKKGFLAGLFKPRKPKVDAGAPLSAISPDATDPAAATAAAPAAQVAAPTTVETAPIDDGATAAAAGTFRYAIGAFSVEANAQTAADALGKAGLTATIQPGKSGGKPIWAVYATGTGDQAGLLSQITSLGFKDAYLVK